MTLAEQGILRFLVAAAPRNDKSKVLICISDIHNVPRGSFLGRKNTVPDILHNSQQRRALLLFPPPFRGRRERGYKLVI
jgi:hypothetical protein